MTTFWLVICAINSFNLGWNMPWMIKAVRYWVRRRTVTREFVGGPKDGEREPVVYWIQGCVFVSIDAETLGVVQEKYVLRDRKMVYAGCDHSQLSMNEEAP